LKEQETKLIYEHYPACAGGEKRGKRLEWAEKIRSAVYEEFKTYVQQLEQSTE
jgi:hypothetical protein